MAHTGASSGVGFKRDNKDEGVITNLGPADKDLGKEREWREGIWGEQSLPPKSSGSLGNHSGRRFRE